MLTILKYSGFWLKKATISLVVLVLALNLPIKEMGIFWGFNDIMALVSNKSASEQNLSLLTGGDSLMGMNQSLPPKMMTVVLTAYSSTFDQTDETPFITASNTRVRDGVVAANFLAFGTKIKIPGIFGDKVFTVEDRMARKHDGKVDIWFPERNSAKDFGVKKADVIILE